MDGRPCRPHGALESEAWLSLARECAAHEAHVVMKLPVSVRDQQVYVPGASAVVLTQKSTVLPRLGEVHKAAIYT